MQTSCKVSPCQDQGDGQQHYQYSRPGTETKHDFTHDELKTLLKQHRDRGESETYQTHLNALKTFAEDRPFYVCGPSPTVESRCHTYCEILDQCGDILFPPTDDSGPSAHAQEEDGALMVVVPFSACWARAACARRRVLACRADGAGVLHTDYYSNQPRALWLATIACLGRAPLMRKRSNNSHELDFYPYLYHNSGRHLENLTDQLQQRDTMTWRNLRRRHIS